MAEENEKNMNEQEPIEESGTEEESNLSEVDIMDLDEESLRQLSSEADEGPEDSDSADDVDESTTGDSDESTTGEEPADETGETAETSEESITEEEDDESDSTTDGDGEDGSGKSGDPLKDTQKAYHAKAEEAAKLRKENLELKKKLHEANAPKKPEEFTAEQLQEMKQYDPEKYAEYLYQKKLYEENKDSYEEQSKQLEEQDREITQQLAAQKTTGNIYAFAQEILDLEEGELNPEVSVDQQPKEFRELLGSDGMKKTMKIIDSNPERYYEKDGSISAETIRRIYRDVAFDDLAVKQREKASRNTVNNIEKAASTKTGLDTASGATGDSRHKKLEDMDEGEIQNLGPEALAELLDEQGL